MCISYVRRFVSSLHSGALFTTRDCLSFGKRSAVDQALFRLVRLRIIVRLARGVFAKNSFSFNFPSPFKVAKVKAAAFGKIMLLHGADIAFQLGLSDTPSSNPSLVTVLVSGSSSSFKYGDTLIRLKGSSMRKLVHGEHQANRLLRALWHLGKNFCSPHSVDHALRFNSRFHIVEDFQKLAAWMPFWLSNQLPKHRYFEPAPRALAPSLSPPVSLSSRASSRLRWNWMKC